MIKNRTALILCHGLFQGLSHRLAQEGGYEKVLYFRPWTGSFPTASDYYVGTGYEDIERIHSYEQYFGDESVTWIFPDLYYAELQEWLRSQGRQVWGSGAGEELELDRADAKELLKEVGLPVKPWAVLTGMEELRNHLKKKENEGVFVKISRVRGLCESFESPNYELVLPKLDSIQAELGMRSEVQEFVVEQAVPDAVEVGFDGFCIDGKFNSPCLVGVEKKDKSYFGRVRDYDMIDKNVRVVNDKLAPTMRSYGYRGFWATEIRVGKDGKPYLIDCTARHSSPAGESILEVTENIAQVIEAGSKGELLTPKMRGKFVAQTLLTSKFAIDHFLPLEIPKEVRPHCYLYHSFKVGDEEGIIPMGMDMEQIGSVVAVGNTPEEAIKLCTERAEQVKGYGLGHCCDSLKDAAKDLLK